MTPRMPVATKHPIFNHTGDLLLYTDPSNAIVVMSCETGEQVNEYPVAGQIKVNV